MRCSMSSRICYSSSRWQQVTAAAGVTQGLTADGTHARGCRMMISSNDAHLLQTLLVAAGRLAGLSGPGRLLLFMPLLAIARHRGIPGLRIAVHDFCCRHPDLKDG